MCKSEKSAPTTATLSRIHRDGVKEIRAQMINVKQQEVLQQIMHRIHDTFPDVKLLKIEELKANTFWITITELPNEEQQFQLDDLVADLSTDALVDYGFEFQFVPVNSEQVAA
jgi:hypothetical protein